MHLLLSLSNEKNDSLINRLGNLNHKSLLIVRDETDKTREDSLTLSEQMEHSNQVVSRTPLRYQKMHSLIGNHEELNPLATIEEGLGVGGGPHDFNYRSAVHLTHHYSSNELNLKTNYQGSSMMIQRSKTVDSKKADSYTAVDNLRKKTSRNKRKRNASRGL